jgi:hypothetical protein
VILLPDTDAAGAAATPLPSVSGGITAGFGVA